MNPVVFDAIKSLLNEGKAPTVALTKSRLNAPVPLPMLIAAVSQYKNNPDSFNNMELKEACQNQTDAQSQLDRIEQKLDTLLALLENH